MAEFDGPAYGRPVRGGGAGGAAELFAGRPSSHRRRFILRDGIVGTGPNRTFVFDGPRPGYSWFIEYAQFSVGNIFSTHTFLVVWMAFDTPGSVPEFIENVWMNGKRNAPADALGALHLFPTRPLLWETNKDLTVNLLTDFMAPPIFSVNLQVLEVADDQRGEV